MIKLLSFLLSFTLLNGQNLVFFLPDDADQFEYWLQSQIKKSSSTLYLLSPSIHYPSLHKSWIKHQSKGYDLILITQSLKNDPRRLIQYQNTYLYEQTARSLYGTNLVLDPYSCHISLPLDQELFYQSSGTILCTDDPLVLTETKRSLERIRKRSKPYLK